MKIAKLTLTLEPWKFDNRRMEMRVAVQTEKEIATAVIPLEEDDLRSRFDIIFGVAKATLKAELENLK